MILLTGAAGFIGSNILAALLKAGHTVWCVDDLTDGRKCRNLVQSGNRLYMDWHDFEDRLRRNEVPLPITAIVHQGAITDTTAANGREMMHANYTFSNGLLGHAAEHDIPMIYASSAAVYGSSRCFEEQHQHEKPGTPYAVSKWMFDNMVRQNGGNKVTGLRYFNVYGSGEEHKDGMASIAYQAFIAGTKRKPIEIFEGSGEIYRDFVYVDDVVDVVMWFLEEALAGNAHAGIYNVGTGRARTFECMAVRALMCVRGYKTADFNLSAFRETAQYVPFPEKLKENYQYYTCADLTALRAAGYAKPFLSLEEGLERYWTRFVS
jgi:ADP-L-glycero-D-manno-heptose 6-epimerase